MEARTRKGVDERNSRKKVLKSPMKEGTYLLMQSADNHYEKRSKN